MKDEIRRDTIHAIFRGVNQDDYTYVAQQLESYGEVLEVLAYEKGRKEAEAKAQGRLRLGLIVGAFTGVLTAWGLIEIGRFF